MTQTEMMRRAFGRPASLLFIFAAVLFLQGCGFRPIYANNIRNDLPAERFILVSTVDAPRQVQSPLRRALKARMPGGADARYELRVSVRESSQRLAVQIDASVTRYNYRLSGRYSVVNRQTGEALRGLTNAVASFNIDASQYSTLFAEEKAREKAAVHLAELIERDVLLLLARNEKDEDAEQPAPSIDVGPDEKTSDETSDETDDPAALDPEGYGRLGRTQN